MVSNTWIRLALAAAVIAVAFSTLPSPVAAQRTVRVGHPAPDITGGPWINSEPLSMEKLRGRVVYVEFWTYG